jgi:hypothetical protein
MAEFKDVVFRKTKNRSSGCYLFTIYHKSWHGSSYLKRFRKSFNEAQRASGGNKRIKLQGRLGKHNPNAYKYQQKRGWNKYQTILLDDAAYVDVYVYEKR